MNAAFANMAYCEPYSSYNSLGSLVKNGKDIFGSVFQYPSLETIVVHFRAPILSKTDWYNRKSELEPFFVPGMKTNALVLVDKEWFREIYMMMNAILLRIYAIVEERGNTKITFCGHGVGGAYAAIAGLSFTILDLIGLRPLGIKFKGRLDISIYTYGQPRTGNIMFARMMNDLVKVTRVTRKNDYVPHFPPIEHERSIMQHHEREVMIGPIDCDCTEDEETVLINGEAIWDCGRSQESFNIERMNNFLREKLWIPGDNLAGENKVVIFECNSGQSIAGENNIQEHYGPYFGITMGDCSVFY
ncbi:hypothetical protein G9A89_018131 [Geosiphon pyriformis]|nr:hypothetical protein G9A89_018131 [Geosiphon pyriformis]